MRHRTQDMRRLQRGAADSRQTKRFLLTVSPTNLPDVSPLLPSTSLRVIAPFVAPPTFASVDFQFQFQFHFSLSCECGVGSPALIAHRRRVQCNILSSSAVANVKLDPLSREGTTPPLVFVGACCSPCARGCQTITYLAAPCLC